MPRSQPPHLARILACCGICMANIAAAPVHSDWRELFTGRVLACGVAAIALLLISLLLRGMLKLISLALVVVLAAGAFWFLREAWGHRAGFLPREWTALAERTLHSPKAQAAWEAVQSELSHVSAGARGRLAAGTDDARRSLAARLESKAAELRKAGNKAEAEELLRLREKFATGR